MTGTILLLVLFLLVIGAIPRWPHNRSCGHRPSGLLRLVPIVSPVLAPLGEV